MNRRKAGLSALILSGLLGLGMMASAPLASATVQVDPNGPAGVQYALPLDSARGKAGGDAAAGVPGARSKAPLFGQGIQPVGSAGAPSAAGIGGPHSGPAAAGGPAGEPARRIPAGIDRASLASILHGGGNGNSMTLEQIALVGGLALVGAGAGLILRRRL